MSEDKALDQNMVNDQVESEPTQETKPDNNIGELVYEAKKHRQDKAKLREELEVLKVKSFIVLYTPLTIKLRNMSDIILCCDKELLKDITQGHVR